MVFISLKQRYPALPRLNIFCFQKCVLQLIGLQAPRPSWGEGAGLNCTKTFHGQVGDVCPRKVLVQVLPPPPPPGPGRLETVKAGGHIFKMLSRLQINPGSAGYLS